MWIILTHKRTNKKVRLNLNHCISYVEHEDGGTNLEFNTNDGVLNYIVTENITLIDNAIQIK